MSVLLSQGVNHAHDALGEAIAALALRAKALLAPHDETSELALGVIVRGLHPRRMGEGPQRIGVLQHVRTGAADAIETEVDASREMALEYRTEPRDEFLELCWRHRSIADVVPLRQEHLCEHHEGLAKLRSAGIGALG